MYRHLNKDAIIHSSVIHYSLLYIFNKNKGGITMGNMIITVSRQYGSGGKTIAAMLAQIGRAHV